MSSAVPATPSHNDQEVEPDDRPIQQAWEIARWGIAAIRAQGGFATLAQKLDTAVQRMCTQHLDCICCMDGRIAPQESAIAVAGSGILVKDDPVAREQLVAFLRAHGIQKVFMHEDCGAVALYAKTKGISLEQAEEESLEWANELTKLLDGEQSPKTLPVHAHFHNETCVYVGLTDHFSLKGITQFPPGFEITVPAVTLTHALAEISVALQIAFGDHGFGHRFSVDAPFTVVIVAENDADLQEMQRNEELVQLVAGYDGRAIVDGFVLPSTA